MGISIRGVAALAGLLLLAASSAPPLQVAVDLKRVPTDLLAPIVMGMVVENRTSGPRNAIFTTADTFDIVATINGEHIWDARWGQHSINVVRKVVFERGRTLVQSNTWDGTTIDKRSVPPGVVQIKVTLLDQAGQVSTIAPITFATPTPLGKLDKVRFNSEVSVVGIPSIKAGQQILTDDTGSVVLSRKLTIFANGHYVVRGYPERTPDGIIMNVERFAPAYDNLNPVATPTPTPTASPIPNGKATLPPSKPIPVPTPAPSGT